MDMILNDKEVRVLGCLIEKRMATPEYYPLSLNALINACNQKSSRNPVVVYDEETVLHAVTGLKEKQLAWQSSLSRVDKYEERFVRDLNLNNQEAAVICLLMLRGPQTVGELKGRTERLYRFDSIEAVNDTLESLASIDLVVRMPRQSGQKEARYSHLMCGQAEESDPAVSSPQPNAPEFPPADSERLAILENKVESLSSDLKELKQSFQDFKRQFE